MRFVQRQVEDDSSDSNHRTLKKVKVKSHEYVNESTSAGFFVDHCGCQKKEGVQP